MTADEVKNALAKAARRFWPNVTKASDLPFPDYWKSGAEWLTFHAPHVGDALMWKLIDGFASAAKEAEERGAAPVPPKVSDEVKAIWSNDASLRAKPHAEDKKAVWEHAAERLAEIRAFAARARNRRRSASRKNALTCALPWGRS